MTCSTAPQVRMKTSGETRLVSVDFGDSAASNAQTGKLSSGELLTGTPTVVQSSSTPATATALTLDNKAINTVTVKINGRDAIAGEAVQFTAASGSSGASYTIKITVGTDGSPAQTLEGFVVLEVKDS